MLSSRQNFSLARAAALSLGLLAVAGLSGCNKLKARDLLNKGVQAFKNGQSDTAIEDFKQATELDPSLLNARIFLATAYSSLYIPGAPSAENLARGNQAIAEFKEVLEKQPDNLTAIDQLGSITFLMAGQPFDPKKFDEAKAYQEKHIQIHPNDPEPYYWIGVIDWTLAFRANGAARVKYNTEHVNKQIKDTDPLPAQVRTDYASQYAAMVDEGISDVQKAIQIRPDYDDAMAYLNLLYRRKADMAATTEERDALLKQADDLLEKIKEIKQKRAEQPASTS
jgi:tetratricopeptide (TPR) repeat protein